MKTADRITAMKTQTTLPPQLSKQSTARSRFNFRPAAALALLAALFALFAAPAAHAAPLTWDTVTGDGATVTAGSGNWNTTAGNVVWNDGTTPNVPWTQTSPTVALNSAIFGDGTDVAEDTYVVTLDSQMAASALTFNNTGYKITGSTLTVSGNGKITVATGKTTTINSLLGLATTATATHPIAGTLNLGGGTSGNGNNIIWNGAGTINLNAGTYTLSNQRFDVPAWNQTGGTVNLGGSSSSGSWIGYQGTAKNVNMTVSGGVFNNNGTAGAYLGIGRAWSGFTATLTVKTGGTVNFGNVTDGNLVISQDGTANTAQLDVQGGSLTVGTGAAANKITLFNGNAGASKNALMTQSGGTVTANGIQFGGASGTIDPTALAMLQLSGGTNYVGALGISLGAGASALPYLIQLQGGTLGAAANWSSALDMKLGTAGGGATIQAADAANVARNITLSGGIADDTAVNGPLTKTGGGTLTLSGAVSYTGPTLVSAGKLVVPSTHTGAGTATVSANAALGVTASGTSQWGPASLTLANPCTLEFNSVQNPGTTTAPILPTAAVGTVSGVTINVNSISGAVAVGNSYPLLGNQGGTTAGYTLGTQPPGVTGSLNFSGTTLVYIVSSVADLWTGADGTNPTWWDIGTTANWTGKALLNSPAGSYANGDAVAFDDAATPSSPVTVELRANVAPGNMLFANSTKDYIVTNSGAFGIGGGGSLTKSGTGTLTLSCPVSYSGATLVSGGKLVFGSTHTGTGAATVSANAVLGVTASGASQWQPASLTLANPCTLDFNSVTNSSTTTAPLRPTAAVGTVSGVTINIKSLSGAVAVNNSYPLLGNQGGTTNGYTLGTQPIGVTGRLAVNGTTLVYIVETATDIWTGADVTNPTWWDIGTTANWTGKALINSPAGTYANGDGVLFNDTATPATPVTVDIQIAVAPGNMVFNSTKAYTVSGAFGIGGTGTLTKSGTGTLTLGTDNSYSGVTTINSTGASGSPILNVAHNKALGSTAGGTVVLGSNTTGGGSTVGLANGITVTDETLTLDATANGYRATLQTTAGNTATWDGNVVLTGTGGLTIFNANGAGANLTVGSSAADTVTGNRGLFIRGVGIGTINSSIQLTSGGLSTADGGTWTLYGNNTYPGDTSIGSGGSRLQLGAANVIPDGVGKGNVTNSISGATLDLNTFSETINGLAGVAGTFVDTVAGGTPTLTVGNADATSTFNGVIRNTAGTLSLIKIGNGTLTLTAANTYTGNTTVNGGTLAIAVASIAANSTVSVANGAVLQLDFAGINAVAGFITNGVPLPAGVYSAANVAPFIAGSGSLEVVAPTGPVIAPVTVSGTDLVVTVPTTSGLNYVLQSTTNLTPTIIWQSESTNAGDGLDLTLNVPIEPGKPQKFLRFWVY